MCNKELAATGIRLIGAGLALWIGVEVAGAAFDLIGSTAKAFP